uniref:E4 SUMO-protein ligase PIAL2 isoform X2 n=1 Tax=Erigeron canadensis TaxID=72917 RepID=UPI001CB8D318|nr:E4 SUMO-protein ligase PIAL2 isoform X2 [Erigeron canadensis]
MTGTVVRPPGGVADAPVDMSNGGQTLSPLYVNSFRISAVTSRLVAHLGGDAKTDNTEFCNLCLSLARGIDYAVASKDVPGRAPDLPNLLKQVCQRKNDLASQAAVMVLMISVKSACTNGWFGEKEKDELLVLSDEMQSSFCSVNVKDMNSTMKNNESNLRSTISTIMSRFYPGMKMGDILSVLETTPGYDSYVTDLHISKRSRTSPDEKIYLFVAQADNFETSSCIISPQQVNFLLNGEGVDRRTCIHKDPGPQMPTPVTHMLKYGSNLLQVVGQFNGKYIIAIAFMSVVSNPSFPIIADYTPPVAAPSDSDNEIVEGPSRISLKCPISFSRIKIPVKGHSCKHLQCFDFNNYVGINSRRPHWRCPHCRQPVCFHDIRIDQSMVKVLKEVGEEISYVKISANGSWEPDTESNEHTEKLQEAPPSDQKTNIQDVDDIMDLTGVDNEVDTNDNDHDRKPSPAGESNVINKSVAPHMEDGFWRDFYSSGLAAGESAISEIVQRNNQLFNSLNQGQSQTSNSNNTLPQQHGNSNNMRHHTWVTRIPNAIQALPAQNSARVLDGNTQQTLSRSHLNQHQAQHMNSQGQHDHSLLSSQTAPQIGGRSASPQHINGGRYASPLSENRFSAHQHQPLNQRNPLPVRSSGQPSPHVRLGSVGLRPNVASSVTPQYSLAAIERATRQQSISQPPSNPPPVQTPGSSVSQRVDALAEENWRPTGRMRGSLSGRQLSEDLNIIQPSEPVQAARPPPILNTPRPFIPPHLQALMANNVRGQTPEAGGSGPRSDSSMAGGVAGVLPEK